MGAGYHGGFGDTSGSKGKNSSDNGNKYKETKSLRNHIENADTSGNGKAGIKGVTKKIISYPRLIKWVQRLLIPRQIHRLMELRKYHIRCLKKTDKEILLQSFSQVQKPRRFMIQIRYQRINILSKVLKLQIMLQKILQLENLGMNGVEQTIKELNGMGIVMIQEI